MNTLYETLEKSLPKLGIEAEQKIMENIIYYCESVIKYNKHTNITGSKTTEDFLIRHVLDSLSAHKYFSESKNICDVGSGAGVPGAPLAIIYPNAAFTLCESKAKKANFLKTLKIENIKIENKNVYEIKEKFDTITAKAFADIKTLLKIFKTLKTPNAILLAYKGKLQTIEKELAECGVKIEQIKTKTKYDDKNVRLIECSKIRAPLIDEERHIMIFK